ALVEFLCASAPWHEILATNIPWRGDDKLDRHCSIADDAGELYPGDSHAAPILRSVVRFDVGLVARGAGESEARGEKAAAGADAGGGRLRVCQGSRAAAVRFLAGQIG